MANTYTLISSYITTGTVATVTIGSIPNTYTDLKIVISARGDRAYYYDQCWVNFNGDYTASNYYNRTLLNQEGTIGSGNDQYYGIFRWAINAASSTSNTYSNCELYIPNYAGSTQKSVSSDGVVETNGTQNYESLIAHLYNQTGAIGSVRFDAEVGNFVAGSTFYIYGISNS